MDQQGEVLELDAFRQQRMMPTTTSTVPRVIATRVAFRLFALTQSGTAGVLQAGNHESVRQGL